MKILIIILMFFALGGLLIISNSNLALHNPDNVDVFVELYSEWIDNTYLNLQTITGNIINMKWMP